MNLKYFISVAGFGTNALVTDPSGEDGLPGLEVPNLSRRRSDARRLARNHEGRGCRALLPSLRLRKGWTRDGCPNRTPGVTFRGEIWLDESWRHASN